MAKPKYRVLWSDDAEQDLLSIWRFSADEWSPATADEYLGHIYRICTMLPEVPELGRSRNELSQGMYSFPVNRHIIYYRITSRGIEILRVLPQRDDLHEIFDRISDSEL